VDLAPLQMAWYQLCDFDLTANYVANIAVNTTFIWGADDGVLPVDQAFVDSFTSTTPTVHTLNGIGHNVQWFAPEEVAGFIKQHIAYNPDDDDTNTTQESTSNDESFPCAVDSPSKEFLVQPHSFISYYQIDNDTNMEVQVFNADQINSTNYSPLLFIHGYTDSRWSFLSTIQCMDIYDRPIIVPSLRGFGDSQVYPVDSSVFSIQQFTEDLVKVLDLLNIDKAVWIGHSMGSFIAHYAAGNVADRVDSIMLLATGSAMDAGLCADIDTYIDVSCPERDFIDAFQERDLIAEQISVQYANQVVRESYKVDLAPLQMAWYQLCDFDLTANYVANIAVNTTFIWGADDGVLPVDQAFVDSFTSTTPTVHIVDGVGHNVQWFVPEEVAGFIKQHIGYVSDDEMTTTDAPDTTEEDEGNGVEWECVMYTKLYVVTVSVVLLFFSF